MLDSTSGERKGLYAQCYYLTSQMDFLEHQNRRLTAQLVGPSAKNDSLTAQSAASVVPSDTSRLLRVMADTITTVHAELLCLTTTDVQSDWLVGLKEYLEGAMWVAQAGLSVMEQQSTASEATMGHMGTACV